MHSTELPSPLEKHMLTEVRAMSTLCPKACANSYCERIAYVPMRSRIRSPRPTTLAAHHRVASTRISNLNLLQDHSELDPHKMARVHQVDRRRKLFLGRSLAQHGERGHSTKV